MTNVKKEKWELRGFEGKADYLGWLHFNNLVDETYNYDDVYYDEYSGETVNITEENLKKKRGLIGKCS